MVKVGIRHHTYVFRNDTEVFSSGRLYNQTPVGYVEVCEDPRQEQFTPTPSLLAQGEMLPTVKFM